MEQEGFCIVFFFVCMLYFVSVTDFKKRIIPDKILLAAVVVRVVYEAVLQMVQIDSAGIVWPEIWKRLLELLFDGLSVSFPLLILTLVMEKVRRKKAFGGGDIKLLFVTGLYLGWEQNFLAVFLACVIMLVVLLAKALAKQKVVDKSFPFGPAIAAGSVLAMFLGL